LEKIEKKKYAFNLRSSFPPIEVLSNLVRNENLFPKKANQDHENPFSWGQQL